MYETANAVQAGTYADLWRKGRYRVQLTAELGSYLEDVDAVLERLGYRMVDADQWGRSYHRRGSSHDTAELDEQECEFGPVRLVLSRGNLDETETADAETELTYLLGRIQEAAKTYDGEPLLPEPDWRDEYRQSLLAATGLEEEA
jgi:hypothetical protein